MTENSHKNHDSSSVDEESRRADAELRKLLSSGSGPRLACDVSQQVRARIRRRMMTVRVTCALAVTALATTGWYFGTNGNELQNLARVANDQPRVEYVPRDRSVEDFESFAIAYQELSSPVVRFQAMEYESDALFDYLGGLETNVENQR